MHIITDENGNPIAHGSEHDHHDHDHDHDHHDHDHHDHDHDHGHDHSHGAPKTKEQMTALLGYMLDHNQHHAEELHSLAHDLKDAGKTDAAEMIHKAVDEFASGNEFLQKALEALKNS